MIYITHDKGVIFGYCKLQRVLSNLFLNCMQQSLNYFCVCSRNSKKLENIFEVNFVKNKIKNWSCNRCRKKGVIFVNWAFIKEITSCHCRMIQQFCIWLAYFVPYQWPSEVFLFIYSLPLLKHTHTHRKIQFHKFFRTAIQLSYTFSITIVQ